MEIDNLKLEECLKHSLKNLFIDEENISIDLKLNTIKYKKNKIKIKNTWNEEYDEEQISLEIIKQIKEYLDNYYLIYNIKSISKILNINFEVILDDEDIIIVKHDNKQKKIDYLSSLKCFKNNETKEIIDLISAHNRLKTKINDNILQLSLGLINNKKDIDYIKIISNELNNINNNEILKYFQILSNKIIIRFNLPIETINTNLLNRKFYFKYFKENKLSENNFYLMMIHGLTKNFTTLKRSSFLKENNYFNDNSIRNTETLIDNYLKFLENKISKKLDIKVRVNSCNTLTRKINILYEKDNELIYKNIEY